jgi:hypothetical protein
MSSRRAPPTTHPHTQPVHLSLPWPVAVAVLARQCTLNLLLVVPLPILLLPMPASKPGVPRPREGACTQHTSPRYPPPPTHPPTRPAPPGGHVQPPPIPSLLGILVCCIFLNLHHVFSCSFSLICCRRAKANRERLHQPTSARPHLAFAHLPPPPHTHKRLPSMLCRLVHVYCSCFFCRCSTGAPRQRGRGCVELSPRRRPPAPWRHSVRHLTRTSPIPVASSG